MLIIIVIVMMMMMMMMMMMIIIILIITEHDRCQDWIIKEGSRAQRYQLSPRRCAVSRFILQDEDGTALEAK